ncbi:catalase [Pseudoxanthomonas winnipegensis]|uniref:catalase n=2 Tax=Pseudoxanthomonas winnipegensis TaxID=2480810 RepID=A0A4Q8L4M5_9GAMM|nr:catalase [Pseudoxanthomonas winnipegensis]
MSRPICGVARTSGLLRLGLLARVLAEAGSQLLGNSPNGYPALYPDRQFLRPALGNIFLAAGAAVLRQACVPSVRSRRPRFLQPSHGVSMTQQSQYRSSQDIVHRIRAILGDFPGYRALHADGRLYRGTFRGNEAARLYTRAQHLQGDAIPATVRFSKGGGDPHAPFGATVGMATRFYLPDGQFTNSVMLSQKLFFSNSIEQFVALLEALKPLPGQDGVNKTGLEAFLAANANVARSFKLRGETPAPVSFAHTEFNSVHAFLFRNAADRITAARVHWIPVEGIRGQPLDALSGQAGDVLFTELEARLQRGPVGFDMELELAGPDDPLDDATALWPPDRERVRIGRLLIERATTEVEIGDPVMNHDPTVLTDGIEATDDPILQIRRGVYEVSAAQRSGGWKRCPFSGAR